MTLNIDTDKVQEALDRRNFGETLAEVIIKKITEELTPTWRDSPIKMALQQECSKIVREILNEHRALIKDKILATFNEKDFVSQLLNPKRPSEDSDDDD